ncbi:hypothetical protein [Vibrio scophthalmi]|uniref:hypothetical protein n=1 Tax=Vibrio scophthalmi TaxID=45658 RepID=UPI0003172B08|nr:hypothetical protein [Vibrio scophthalmi]
METKLDHQAYLQENDFDTFGYTSEIAEASSYTYFLPYVRAYTLYTSYSFDAQEL